MKLIKAITTYVTFKRSLGLHFDSDDCRLRRFCRTMGGADVNMRDVTPAAVLAYLDGKGPVTAGWGLRFHTLDRFYRFAISRGFTASSPLPTDLPQLPPPFVPYIYSNEELRRMIAATAVTATPTSPLQALTFRTLLLLLYGSAIRIGEAVSLTLTDVDLEQSILTVRNTKFYKYAAPLAMSALCLATANLKAGTKTNRHSHGLFGQRLLGGPGHEEDSVEDAVALAPRAGGSVGRLPCAVRASAGRTGISVRHDP